MDESKLFSKQAGKQFTVVMPIRRCFSTLFLPKQILVRHHCREKARVDTIRTGPGKFSRPCAKAPAAHGSNVQMFLELFHVAPLSKFTQPLKTWQFNSQCRGTWKIIWTVSAGWTAGTGYFRQGERWLRLRVDNWHFCFTKLGNLSHVQNCSCHIRDCKLLETAA